MVSIMQPGGSDLSAQGDYWTVHSIQDVVATTVALIFDFASQALMVVRRPRKAEKTVRVGCLAPNLPDKF